MAVSLMAAGSSRVTTVTPRSATAKSPDTRQSESRVPIGSAGSSRPRPQGSLAVALFDGRKSSEWARQARDRKQWMTAAWYAAAGEGNTSSAAGEPVRPSVGSESSSAAAAPSIPATGHSEAWWHGVAICEQGGRNDSYFGYFSYMDGSEGGGKSWAEQVARGNQTIAQYGDHAWAQQCINAGYAASPGG